MADDEESEALRSYLLDRGLGAEVRASKGRCLVANKYFKRGDLILAHDPFCSVLDANASTLRCDGCFVLCNNLLRCSACKTVHYCSVDCQRGEWKLHKDECRIMSGKHLQDKERLQIPTLRLMIRLLVKRQLQKNGVVRRTPVDTIRLVEALPTHHVDTNADRLVLFAQMSNLLKAVVTPMEVDLKETTRLFCRFSCNAHTICDEELRPVGTGLYPIISIINHSCQPNAVLLFHGKTAVVRCLEDVNLGAEVVVSYIDLASSTPTRQKALKEQYYFDCRCPRCARRETSEGMIEDGILEGYKCSKLGCDGACLPLSDGKRIVCHSCGSMQVEFKLKALRVDTTKLLDEAAKADASGHNVRAKELFEHAENLQENFCHRYSVQLMRTRDRLLKVNMSLKDFLSAYACCQMTLPAYEKAYGPRSPLLGLQFYTLGKLAWYLGETTDAIEAFTRAYEILSISHSTSSTLVVELANSLQEAHSEANYKSNTAP